jgi:tetratricopeptide (TPR) repeat protein
LAPEAWFDYLAERPHRLEGVFRHNRDDVLSLVALTAYLGHVLGERRDSGEALAGCPAQRARALARAFAAAGDHGSALRWIDTALERDPDGRRELLLVRARCLRRLGQGAAARQIYEGLLAESDDALTLPACLELAKLSEHHLRDLVAARDACQRASGLLASMRSGLERDKWQADLTTRLARLERRLARSAQRATNR